MSPVARRFAYGRIGRRMMADRQSSDAITGECDGENRLVRADPKLLALHRACGGEVGGRLAVPALSDLVAESRHAGSALDRTFMACNGTHRIEGRARIKPAANGDQARSLIRITDWRAQPLSEDGERDADLTREITRQLSECVMQIDAQQHVVSCETEATDLLKFADTMRSAGPRRWDRFVDFTEPASDDSDVNAEGGRMCRLRGSMRDWRCYVEKMGNDGDASGGQEEGAIVYFTAESALAPEHPGGTEGEEDAFAPSLGRDLTPVLRQPVNRIIAHAQTMRTKLAGPLSDQYRTYAEDIANAGQHLLGLMDDLADLEVVEAETFATAPDRIDLADVARRACGILGVRAREKDITLVPPAEGETQPAIAEFRRVLQVLLNLVGNAIRYSPEASQVWVRVDCESDQAMVTVADQGHGLDEQQQDKVFEKFERLGRSGDNGSGLGLYISRRIARAMDGDLTVESAPGQGARFTLSVPAEE